MSPGGLRERKKLATRAALSEAAMRLVLERGVENVSAEAIAEAVGVSPRTFHNYFANKEEAILEAFWSKIRVLGETLRRRPADEPILDSLQHVMTMLIEGTTVELRQAVRQMKIIEASPALLLPNRSLAGQIGLAFGQIIAERTGTDLDTDMYPNLIMSAAHGALMAAMRLWNRNPDGPQPDQLMREAFDLLRAGLPEPPTRQRPAGRPAPPTQTSQPVAAALPVQVSPAAPPAS